MPLSLLLIVIPVGVELYLVVLSSVSLMAKTTEHLFMFFGPFVYLLWRTVYSNPLPILKLGGLFIDEV